MSSSRLKESLEDLYQQFNNPSRIHPDPLEFVVTYQNVKDREIVALIAACLAYGRVQAILKSVSSLLAPMEGRPRNFLASHTPGDFTEIYRNFVHRFTKGRDVARLLSGMKNVIEIHGSLYRCFLRHDRPEAQTILPGLTGFVGELRRAAGAPLPFLLPDPEKGSALKRLNLFLRWMVRRDRVDPGGWNAISPTRLLYPLDTHIYAFARRVGFTRRKSADLKATLEISARFRKLNPKDPVKYDFALARVGILNMTNLSTQMEIKKEWRISRHS